MHKILFTFLLWTIPFLVIEAQTRKIQLKIEGLDGSNAVVASDNGVFLSFSTNGTEAWDIYDATKLLPLSSTYINAAFLGDRNGSISAKTIDSRPLHISNTMDVNIRYYTQNVTGTGRWSIHEVNNIPASWQISLIDNTTGITTNLRTASYTFALPSANGTYDGRFTLRVNPMLTQQFTIDSQGWSLVGFPFNNTFADIKTAVWTQGFTGADNANGTSNIYTYSESTAGFVKINAVTDVIDWTKGFALFTFLDDDPNTTGVQGTAQKTVSVALPYYKENITKSLTYSGSSSSGWHLLSNPFWENMQVNQLGISGNSAFTQFVYVWNMQTQVYDVLPSNSTTNVAPFRGFWVLVNQNTSITFSATAPSSKVEEMAEKLTLKVTEMESGRNSAFLAQMSERFSRDVDSYDAPILEGIGGISDLGYFLHPSETHLKAISLPSLSNEKTDYEIPFVFTTSGEHSVNVESTFLNTEFYLSTPSKRIALEGETLVSTAHGEVWTLGIVSKTQTNTELRPTVAESIQLAAYPNPFNPTTTISLDVTEHGLYTFEVRDIVGRVVLTMPNRFYSTGSHVQQMDASSWSSGIYIVRVFGKSDSKSIKINLIR